MITGDNPLTACHVARELRFSAGGRTMLILSRRHDGQWGWRSIDETVWRPLEPTSWRELLGQHDLCVTGEGVTFLQQHSERLLHTVLPHVRVFARVAPKQKELVITSLKQLGFVTLMCGDGTNDVGALKHAHVGTCRGERSPSCLLQLGNSRPVPGTVSSGTPGEG